MGFLDLIESHKELLFLMVATAGGAFALWRWFIDQRWRRVQHAQSLIKEFVAKDNTSKAFEILDSIGQIDFGDDPDRTRELIVTNHFLIGALSTFDQKEENTENEMVVRMILDRFFEDLNTFQSHIDARLIKTTDIKPYLEYWLAELTGKGRVHDDIRFGIQVRKYLEYFGYNRVLRLAKNTGHPFPGNQ